MALGTLETLATILIVVTVIKLVCIYFNPKGWIQFTKNLYKNVTMARGVLLVLAAIVLYYLIDAGMTIVQILAVTVFVVLLISMELVPYYSALIKQIKITDMWSKHGLEIVIWLALLAWGAKVIFFS